MFMKEILIAPNSFKECASSYDASIIIKNALIHCIPEIENYYRLNLFPISDGGDGFLETVKYHFNTESLKIAVKSIVNGEDYECPFEYSKADKTVYIESARVIGLNLIPRSIRNPLKYNSAPLGSLIKKIGALKNNSDFEVSKVVIGIGGTATSDLGVGMLSEFGLKLFDAAGKEVNPIPENFIIAERMIKPEFITGIEISIVLDVENPLLGDEGAVKVFAEQKGADKSSLDFLESGFEQILRRMNVRGEMHHSFSGAGGGLAASFQIFGNPSVMNAGEFILKELGLLNKCANPDLIITGEGKLDKQTLMNKGGMIVLNSYKKSKIPVCFIAGENILNKKPEFLDVLELKNYFSSIEESIAYFKTGIFKACEEISRRYLNKN